jgi:hypothetical protein
MPAIKAMFDQQKAIAESMNNPVLKVRAFNVSRKTALCMACIALLFRDCDMYCSTYKTTGISI